MIKDHGAVLIADVGPLAIQRGWIVVRPENVEELIVTDNCRIEFHFHHFGVSGRVTTNTFVGRVLRLAAGVSDNCFFYSRHGAKGRLDPPETTGSECRFLCGHGTRSNEIQKGANTTACHPEAGEARRGISQALNRYREIQNRLRHRGAARRLCNPTWQLGGPSPSARLGMTCILLTSPFHRRP